MVGRPSADQTQPVPLRLAPEPGAARAASAPPGTLGRLIGRERELAAVADLIGQDDVRLLTLTGPGGVGKTRLALEVAAELADDADAEVTFVELASTADPGRVMTTVARAYGLQDDAVLTTEQQLRAALGGARRIMILDNFEHVAAAGPAVAALAAACPHLTILITSRLRLRLTGEHEFPILPLPLPVLSPTETPSDVAALGQNPAVALFVQRAAAAKPGFALSEANAATVAELCRRLDGLPLAIELAAARSGALSPKSMLARLSGHLQLLGDGPVDAPPRLRSMRDAVGWSIDQLSEDAAALFRRLAVFASTISIDAVEAIAGEIPVVPSLTALVDAGLLQQPPAADEQSRYRMLETVREIARERLEAARDADDIQLLLAEYFRDLSERATLGIQAAGQERWFPILDAEQDNIRASIDWAIGSGRAGLALQMIVGPLWFFWSMSGRARGERPVLERALVAAASADPPVEPAIRAKALFTDALYFFHTGDYDRARSRYEESLAVCQTLPDPDRVSLPVLSNLGILDNDQGRYAEARDRFEAVLAIRRRIGEPSQTARTLVNLGNVTFLQGDYAASTRFLEEALPIIRQTGERRLLAHCLAGLGEIAADLGRDTEALASFDQAIGLFRQAGDIIVEGTTLANLAAVALRQGDIARAAAALAEVFEQQREAKTPIVVADALDGAAAVAVAAGQPRLAPQFLAVAAAIRSVSRFVPTPAVRRRADRTVGAAKAALGRAGFDAATVAARAVTTDEAMARATRMLTEIAPQPVPAIAAGSTNPAGPAEPSRPHLAVAVMPVALTRRQREVLRLLVAGMTDPEIGEELGIGVRTVESHVATILGKLRVHARTAAVAYAVRHGLG